MAERLRTLDGIWRNYLFAQRAVYEDRGREIDANLSKWGEELFTSVFQSEFSRAAYARTAGGSISSNLVLLSRDPLFFCLLWELMKDTRREKALSLELEGFERRVLNESLNSLSQISENYLGGTLRILMITPRPTGSQQLGNPTIARLLDECCNRSGGGLAFNILRPPTFSALQSVLNEARDKAHPYRVLHFDGYIGSRNLGNLPGKIAGKTTDLSLIFEDDFGTEDRISVSAFAATVRDAQAPIVVLSTGRSGSIDEVTQGPALALSLLEQGIASVVSFGWSLHAIAATEFLRSFNMHCLTEKQLLEPFKGASPPIREQGSTEFEGPVTTR